MITQEMFDGIVKKITEGEGCTVGEATELVQTIAEFEQRNMIAQQIVEFVLHAAEQVFEENVERSLLNLQLRDVQKVKTIRALPRKAASQLSSIVQLYIAQMFVMNKPESAISDTDPDILLSEETA
jgi:hypothetical protein